MALRHLPIHVLASAMRSASSILVPHPPDGLFHDILRHVPDQEQTTTYCSSVDPWHEASDLGTTKQAQVGFDVFFTSGVTRGLPAMMPVALLYDTPENAVAEVAYLKKRNYPISYIEMGEEADGQYLSPEDYGALYVQWATALHRLDPALKLGGPSFQGVNQDIQTWPDVQGNVSWTSRFIEYLKRHDRMKDLAFFSFEHYPYDPCRIPWGSLYEEPQLVSHIMQVWREDGVPPGDPALYYRVQSLFFRVPAKPTWISFRALARRLYRFVPDCWREGSLLLPLSAAADGARMQ